MKPLVSVSVALALASLPAAVIAQVTQIYQYDANGRLIGVTTTGSGGTNTAAYAYDDADNRTSRSQTGATAWAALSELRVGDTLNPDQALVAPNGRFTFAYRPSGRLELWRGDEAVWSFRPSDSAPSFDLAVTGAARLRLSPALSSVQPAHLAVRDDGRLVLRADGAVLWLSDNHDR